MSKNVDTTVLRTIQDAITASKVEVTEAEALQMAPKIKAFVEMHSAGPTHALTVRRKSASQTDRGHRFKRSQGHNSARRHIR